MSHNNQMDTYNPEQQQAFELVASTNKSLFITGKAGTGKTTFVRRLQKEIDKAFLVLAPTGIAALAAGGQTLHSFFGFPMTAIGPKTDCCISYDNKSLLQHVDTIIIDEVSMLRCDIVDGMDRCLRSVLNNNSPFGGKQIVFVGDLFQLPPVVKPRSADDEMLRDLYGASTPFFYKAHALRQITMPKIEFRKIYRQSDDAFVNVLNKIRVGEIDDKELALLNSRVSSNGEVSDYAVILCSHNNKADEINESRLKEIDGEAVLYEGVKEGKFDPRDSLVPQNLRLKIGAQVIFCRNNFGANCANGTIAKVVKLGVDVIKVELEDGVTINVNRTTWESYEREYNRHTRKIESKLVGSYTQFPLKLAWAITIHKSQGMTFDRMHFDLSRSTFAPGQTYVAISRVRSLEGLTLSNVMMRSHIITSPDIKAFANLFNDKDLINSELKEGKELYTHLRKKDYNSAALTLLDQTIAKYRNGEFRNASLSAKRMFDEMLDDECLIGKTDGFETEAGDSTSCNFVNSVLCLYGHRYEEAIGFVNLVLSARPCPEAMYVKARAYYELGDYVEASNTMFEIISLSQNAENKKAIDKRLNLFEAKLNDKIGNPNIAHCKKLIKQCPECIEAYALIRNEMFRSQKALVESGDNQPDLVRNFDDKAIDSTEYCRMIAGYGARSEEVRSLRRLIFTTAA